MTTIAYRDGVMAADTQMSLGDDSKVRVSKIERLPCGSLFGCAGDSAALVRIKAWARLGFPPRRKPRPRKGSAFECLLVKTDGTVSIVNDALDFEPLSERYWAIGTGAPWAVAAMDCRRGAAAAVRIAARRDRGTSLPVETLVLR